LLLGACATRAAEPLAGAAVAPATPAAGPVATYQGDPKYVPPALRVRGKEQRPPGGIANVERNPIIWGWRLTLPDGRGLGFGGISPRTDDSRPETELLRDGQWTPIHAELRQRNPLQGLSDRLAALRLRLQRATQFARYGWLEGLDAQAETKHLALTALPLAKELSGALAGITQAMDAFKSQDAYFTGQIAFAKKHLAMIGPALSGIAPGMGGPQLDALRQARIHLEIATDALDAAPSARALSQIAYEEKSGLFVIFGGDHLDYLGNDLWVFDPRAMRWQQRHPPVAPEPRAEHLLAAGEPGKVVLKGGYLYGQRKLPGWDSSPYVSTGPDEWIYDLAADTWSAPAGQPTFPADTRTYREGAFLPDHFTSGPRPDLAAHAKKLAGLPVNTWVSLSPAKTFAWNRDWGTVAYDPDRDLLCWYTGGHSAYPGSDVAHYHLAVNTWDQPVETELPPGFIGTNEPMLGWSFNRRPWMGHQYKSYAYHPGLKKMLMNGRQGNSAKIDQFGYLYDADAGTWVSRHPTPVFFDRHGAQLQYSTQAGMLTWYGKNVWQFDVAGSAWKQLPIKGDLRGTCVDNSGCVIDPKRGRELFFAATGYAKPYDGAVFALNLATMEASSFQAEGTEHIPALTRDSRNHFWNLREIAWHPGLDLIIFDSLLPGGYMPALDPVKNRWVGLKVTGDFTHSHQAGFIYDQKRDLLFIANASAQVFALRVDPKTAVIKTFAEIAAEMPSPTPATPVK
jgi:hypothetical protein